MNVFHARGRKGKSIEDRFYEKVKKGISPDDCWEWTGTKHNRGYGYFYTSPTYSARKMDFAHRISIHMHTGIRRDDLCVLHSCDNTSCVNPSHLSYGTQSDNIQDMVSKGRCSNGQRRLLDSDYQYAKQARLEGIPVKHIAETLNIDKGYASRISRGIN